MLNLFKSNESGATAVEYGLIIALLGAVTMGAFKHMGTIVHQKNTEMSNTIQFDPADRPRAQGDIAPPAARTTFP